MGTEPAVQRIALPLYQDGAHDDGLEFEMGARALSERDYEAAAQHMALVIEGPKVVQAQLLRTLALGLLGRQADARAALKVITPRPLSAVQASSVRWLEHLLDSVDRSHSPDGRQP
jgi:hypothetical protein